MKIREIIEVQQDNNLSLGTMPTTDYVKGIYAAAAENGMGAPDVEAVKKQMVLAPNGEVDIMKTMQRAVQVFQSPEWKQMLADLDALIKKAEGMKESKQKGVDGKACWDGYKRMGTKKKGGKTVDNCVKVGESATAGATSTANIGTVVNPHISPGPARGKKSYLGSPTTGSGTKSPPQPKVVQPKNKDGTAKAAHDIKGASLFGGPTIKRR